MFVNKLVLSFLLLMTSCSNLMYFPSKLYFDNPKRHKLQVQNHTITTADHLKLRAWLLSSSEVKTKKGLVLQYHGNAENLTSHYKSMAWLAYYGYDVLIFDYRGYGASEGEPTPQGMYLDSQAVLEYALNYRHEHRYKNFIVVAQSLGGSIALKTLSEQKNNQNTINLVIFDSTFRSNSEIGSSILRKSWVTWLISPLAYILMHDTYNAQLKDLQNWQFPTLCITHPKDPVVPSELTVKLYHSLNGNQKKWLWVRDDIYGGHVSAFFTPEGPLNKKLLDFLEKEIP